MIITLTANPSIDRTVELPSALARGEVHRALNAHQEAGGKGVNVSRALTKSGVPSLALLPGDEGDPVLAGLAAASVPYRSLPIGAALRTNTALTEPDGTTTKVNEPGPVLSPQHTAALLDLVVEASAGASWLVLAGSLPPGVSADFYASATAAVRKRYGSTAPRVAVDSSGSALAHAAAGAPDLLKPNAEELSELTGLGAGAELETDLELALQACTALIGGGVGAVLATLGSRGALLVTASGAWHARHSPVTARSTVGAGDSALAGYLLAAAAGEDPEGCLRQAVAHGSAAASLPGSEVPALNQTTPEAVTLTAFAPALNSGAPAHQAASSPKEEN
ncbi:1-phosphofructokinase family hexose kinase [Arthrobacter sp. TMN-37]